VGLDERSGPVGGVARRVKTSGREPPSLEEARDAGSRGLAE